MATHQPSSNPFPAVSVIIPTRDREADLERAVESLCRQTIAPAQLVVVDQSDSAAARETIGAQLARATDATRRLQFDYIHDRTLNGASAARNRAMDVATGDVWLFLDDDVVLEPAFIEQILAVYLADPFADGVSGIITNYTRGPLGMRVWSRIFLLGPFFDERQPIYWRAAELAASTPLRVTKFGGGLMSFPADRIRLRRFDERLAKGTWGEDTDFTLQLGPNAHLFIAPQARLAHYHSSSGRTHDHWLFRFVECYWFLYYKDWSTGPANWLRFQWLKAGCALAATAASVARGSLEPWRSLGRGTRSAAMLFSQAQPAATRANEQAVIESRSR